MAIPQPPWLLSFHDKLSFRPDFPGQTEKMLQKLPTEIITLVIDKITNISDLKRLCEVSKILNNITIPYLYKEIIIEATDEIFLQDLDVEPLLRTCSKPISHLSYVKKVQVLSRFHRNLKSRCIHNHFEDMELDDSDEEGDEEPSSFAKLTTNLMSIFRQLKDGSLRSFSWELGTCVPSEILGRSGYLENKQSSIETLSLITGGSCGENLEGECPVDLSAFRSLRGISWVNLRSAEDFEALGGVLHSNSAHLTELRLDFVDWSEADDFWFMDRGQFEGDRSENFFVRDILKLSVGEVVVKFPALETLFLREVSFASAAPEMLYAFNLSRLRSLTLRNCPDSEDFLRGVIELGQPIRLISLEVLGSKYDFDISEAISTFLGAFEGLESLYVVHTEPAYTIEFWRSMIHHKSTLTRFAYHQRLIDLDIDSFYFEKEFDLSDLSLSSEDVAELRENPLHHPFQEFSLECIGLSCNTYYLKPILEPFITKHTLKILHIRRSGSELARLPGLNTSHDRQVSDVSDTPGSDQSSSLLGQLYTFANWAFGPGGFPVLEILAFGDFSYQGRFSRDTLLLCRDKSSGSLTDPYSTEDVTELTFRNMRKTDGALWDLLKRNADFLEACPIDSILDD